MDDRRYSIEKGELCFSSQIADGACEIGRCEWACGNNDAVPNSGRTGDLSTFNRYAWMAGERSRHRLGKAVAVNRQRATRRYLVCVCSAHDQRTEPAHFLVQKADSVVLAVVGAE